jgi:galactokinase
MSEHRHRPVIAGTEFRALFGVEHSALAEEFGRVTLIGEHTDYNDGFVLPTSIPQSTVAAVARRSDRTVRAWSAELSGGPVVETFVLGEEQPRRGWLDYPQGLTRALGRVTRLADSISPSGRPCRSEAGCRRARHSRSPCSEPCATCSR